MMRIKTFLLALCGVAVFSGSASAQNVGIKTNFVTWATTTPNLALEFGLGKRTTLEIGGTYNWFNFKNDKKFKNWTVQPEFRYWTCERFNRGFWGIHAMGGEFNVAKIDTPFDIFPLMKDYRLEGWFVGGGVSYGYNWYLGPHWNLEATIGVGYLYIDMDRYVCGECGDKLKSETRNYVGPTKLGLSLVYLF